MPSELTRHLAAVMFTDMAGYTALMRRDEAAALRCRRRHREALEKSVEGRDGEVLQYFGDGSLSLFSSIVQAVEAALDIQRALQGDPSVRIGLHAGEVAYDVQGVYGDAVNIAARLEALCPPGGVTISHKIYDDLRRHPQIAVVPMGTVHLKNVDEDVAIYALALEGLETPSLDPATVASSGSSGLPIPVVERLDELVRRPADPFQGASGVPGQLPLIGRDRELDEILAALDRAEHGQASVIFVRGLRGVGKTALTRKAARLARERRWTVLRGRAHPAEGMVPYAPFADALLPLLRDLDHATLSALTPGSGAALCTMFPALGPAASPLDVGVAAPGEARTRLYWQFAGFLGRLAAHRPLLIVLEDLDFSDRASLRLLEFVGRQARDTPLVVLAEYSGTDTERREWLRTAEQRLVAQGIGRVFELEPLSLEAVTQLIRHAFDLERDDSDRLSRAVYTWSRGNPFFLAGTLRDLVEREVLETDGTRWTLGALDDIRLPHSVRDAVLSWTQALSTTAREVARTLAVVGREASYGILRSVTGIEDSELADALDELVRHQLVHESQSRWSLSYGFRNPFLRETLRSELSLAARRALHTRVGRALEAHYGDARDDHADEIAYHLGRAHDVRLTDEVVHYLTVAGRSALAKQANREAAGHFTEALERLDAAPPGVAGTGHERGAATAVVVRGLARARRRLGDTSGSAALWRRLLASAADDDGVAARIHLELGLTFWGAGALEEALEAFGQAASLAAEADDEPTLVRAQLTEALCLQYAGDPERASVLVESSLQFAQRLDDPMILGRVQRARIQHHLWTGRIPEARQAADAALALSQASRDRGVEFWSRWAMGAMEGLLGNTERMASHIAEARDIADDIGSPFLDLATRELQVELAYARGEWDKGVSIGTEAIDLARATDQRLVLPRLLVWLSMILVARGELDEADRLTAEAWRVAGAERAGATEAFVDLHAVVPAHIGRAAVALARGDWDEAIAVAEAGLAIADRSGYIVWSMHHILPIIGEAAIHSRQLDRAATVGARMRTEAERVGHPLALAWAEVCDGVLTWLQNDATVGAESLRRAAEALEEIPMVYDAARVRRQLAGRLAELGDREGALAELTHVHSVFQRLGARPELAKTLIQFEELGADPPEVDSVDL